MNFVCHECGSDKVSGYITTELDEDEIVKHYCSSCLKKIENEDYESEAENQSPDANNQEVNNL
ncbi:MAG: hypothetical protein KKA79_05295 [Nanoarchaeota archaeon]|nr:hypothetical protein [Nanoarchaeota archaeon]MCG2717885.1 hypothetical protein [Nanoarchaeota archaeon]